MGGGAGVWFKIRLDGFHFNTRGGKLKPTEKVTIKDWECFGYMDGMGELRGDLLKLKGVYYDLTQEDKDYLKADGVKRTDILWCPPFVVENLEWAGWIRGKWQDAFPMTLKGTVRQDYLGEIEIAVEVDVADREEFDGFWKDVFDYTVSDEDLVDDDGRKYTVEQMYEIQNDACRVNYGVPAPVKTGVKTGV